MLTDRIVSLRTKHADFYAGIRGTSAKGLREKKGGLVAEIRGLADKINAADGTGQFSAEDEAKWRTVNEHYDVLEAQIQEAEDPLHPANARDRWGAIEAASRIPAGDGRVGRDPSPFQGNRQAGQGGNLTVTDEIRALAFSAWARTQFGEDISAEMADACRAVGLNPNTRKLRMPLLATGELRKLQSAFANHHPSRVRAALDGVDYRAALSSQGGPSGAYLIPPETLIRQLEINMLYYGGMRQVAETITTATGERMPWPTADDTANAGVQLGENTSTATTKDPAFGKVYWDAYKFSSGGNPAVLVPYELLQDSAFKLPEVLGELLGIRLGRITNTKYTIGSGAGTPKGLVVAAPTFSAISSSAIFWDDLFGLVHSIDPAYRTSDCGFMCHDNVVLGIRKLKSGTGEYLWEPGLQQGVPDKILGYRFTVNQDMDGSFVSGKKTVAFGQLFKYKIRRVGEMRLYRLEERFRELDQDGFLAFIREDGNLLTAGTAPVKVLAH